MAAAFLIAYIIAKNELARHKAESSAARDITLVAAVAGIVGSKLYFAISNNDFPSLFVGSGYVFFGGLVGGILGVSLVVKLRGLNFWVVADVCGLALPAAYAVGRTGCWAVGDDYGRPWEGLGSVKFPEGAPPSTVENMDRFFHIAPPIGSNPADVLGVYPTQLYEIALSVLIFVVLWRLRYHRHMDGWLFGCYCALGGLERFAVEFFRAKDDRFLPAGLTIAQLIAGVFVLSGLFWLWNRWTPRPVLATVGDS